MYDITEITEFVTIRTGCDNVNSESDILNDLGCSGDDFHELIDEYAKQFNVDISNYLWYFHTDEESHSHSFGSAFFKTPYERVERIPITPKILLEFANTGKWNTVYSTHELPKRRYDILINQLVALLFILFCIYKCAK